MQESRLLRWPSNVVGYGLQGVTILPSTLIKVAVSLITIRGSLCPKSWLVLVLAIAAKAVCPRLLRVVIETVRCTQLTRIVATLRIKSSGRSQGSGPWDLEAIFRRIVWSVRSSGDEGVQSLGRRLWKEDTFFCVPRSILCKKFGREQRPRK
jgi:hypothetical protein